MTTTEAKKAMQDRSKVEAGEGEDHDIGVIHAIDGEKAFVAWQSGVKTWTLIVDLAIS